MHFKYILHNTNIIFNKYFFSLRFQTALSYLCSTNVTQFLEVLLQTPGIDINKPDIELNTPLHYASECGKSTSTSILNKEQNYAKLLNDSK